MAVDIAIHPTNPDVLFAACGNFGSAGNGIYRSQNGGDTWQKLGGGLPATFTGNTKLCVFPSPFTLYADVANSDRSVGLYRSGDQGQSWTRVNQDTLDWASYQGWYSHYVRVDPQDNSQVLFAGVQIYRSTNGGATKQLVSGPHLDHHAYADDPANPGVVYGANDGGVWRSPDRGQTWREMNNGYVTSQFYNGFSSSGGNASLALGGLQDNSVVIYSGGPVWRSLMGTIGGDGTMTAIDPQNDNRLYLGLQHLMISRSENGGQSWQSISQSIQDNDAIFGEDQPYPNSCSVSPYAVVRSQPATLFAGNQYVNRSDDRGNTWRQMNDGQPLNGNPISSLGLAPSDANTVYAATVPTPSQRAQVFVSTNGGTSFRNITGGLPDRYYVDLIVSSQDADAVYITLSGFGSSHLYYSDNGGTTWNDLGQGLPDMPTSALAIDPDNENHLYAGNDLGVYVSLDHGQSWSEWKEGMPAAALAMDLSIAPGRRIRVATHGNGVYERALLSATGLRQAPVPSPTPRLTELPQGIEFFLLDETQVSLEILTAQGRPVRLLASGVFAPGRHVASWEEWRGIAPGAYVCRLRAGGHSKSIRVLRR
jgi:photosystem II stability/assembly factor-like uncharacterized protein